MLGSVVLCWTGVASGFPADSSTSDVLLRPLQTVLGYSDGDVLGMSCLTVCGPATDKKAMRQIIQLQRSGQAGATKVLCYRRDGSPFW